MKNRRWEIRRNRRIRFARTRQLVFESVECENFLNTFEVGQVRVSNRKMQNEDFLSEGSFSERY